MDKRIWFAILPALVLALPSGMSSACDAYVPCEKVLDIHTGEGRHEAFGVTIWHYYGANVRLDPAWRGLEKAYAACPNEILEIQVGEGVFKIDKASVSASGDWFATTYRTAVEALDAAMSMCPEKVINHIPKQPKAPE